ncbi:MAG: hypothetical protein RLY31_3007 [Bacteroidota bacterium]|jgi:hypothetical protein
MHKLFPIVSLLSIILVALPSCKEHSSGPEAPGVIEIEFYNVAVVNGIQQ